MAESPQDGGLSWGGSGKGGTCDGHRLRAAHKLIIAEDTAKAHTRHIYEKLGVSIRQELLDLLMAKQ